MRNRKRRALTAAVLFLLLAPLHAAEFEMTDHRLTVRSSKMEVGIEDGRVLSIKDIRTGEVFTDAGMEPRGFTRNWGGGYPARAGANRASVRPAPGAQAEFRRISETMGELTYRELVNAGEADECVYRITVDDSGEISLQTVYRLEDTPVTDGVGSRAPAGIPVENLVSRSVIMGTGRRYMRSDPPTGDEIFRGSPVMLVVEGEKSSLLFSARSFDGRGDIYLDHSMESDCLVLRSQRDYREECPNTITSLEWTIGVFPDWLEAARHYREVFRKKTGVRFLWENRCEWFRDIHAVHTGRARRAGRWSPDAEEHETYYRNLSEVIDPENLLLFYWNGSGIVLFGDHRLTTSLGGPHPHVVEALKRYGFRWFPYHPYILVRAPEAIEEHLQTIVDRGWGLPEDYTFEPDYDGEPEDFYEYFADVSANYYSGAVNLVLHPGSRKVRDYLVRNFINYCRFHDADGAYLDILGAENSFHFPEDRKVIEGLNYRDGARAFLREVNEKHPDLVTMSEVTGEWTVPYAPFTWASRTVDHPLKTAVWGSFMWHRETRHTPSESALTGVLPSLDLEDEWSVARAQMFTEKGLHNDLPDEWDGDLLAHYRTRDGGAVQYRKTAYGQGFVESGGADGPPILGVFTGVSASPFDEPVRISGWSGYEDGRAIGLNPEAEYKFIPGAPAQGDRFTVSGLPEGVFIKSVRHGEKWSVLELGTGEGGALRGEVNMVFHREYAGVSTAGGDIEAPFAAGEEKAFELDLPGGLVVKWAEPEPVDSRFRSNLATQTGRIRATGIVDDQWAYNSAIRRGDVTFEEVTYPSINIGFGRYRGYAEGWVELAADAEPVLKFELGYPEGRLPEVDARVLVNGREVWREDVEGDEQWQPREVPLKEYAGRRVLITLCAGRSGYRDGGASHTHSPVSFGRVRVDGNPHSLDPPGGEALGKPAEILFADDFDGEELGEGWHRQVSPATGDPGRIGVEDGRLVLTSDHDKYCYIYRRLDGAEGNISVQARLRITTGQFGPIEWHPGIGLFWEGDSHVFITGGGHHSRQGFNIAVRGRENMRIDDDQVRLSDDNRYDFWVRIDLDTDEIRYYYSVDGERWELATEVPRPEEKAGAPEFLIAGKGMAGEGELFSSDGSDGVPPGWRIRTDSLLEVFVGKGR